MKKDLLILCNRWHAIPRDYQVELHTVSEGVQIDKRMQPAFEKLMAALNEKGFHLGPLGAYRTWQLQEEIMASFIRRHEDEGHSPEEARILAERRVAIPGTSEHQLGLAVDIEPPDENNDEEGLYVWLAENAHRFGFVLRYPAEKTHITGIQYEPWHFRYVGLDAAQEMFERCICLEEYLGILDV